MNLTRTHKHTFHTHTGNVEPPRAWCEEPPKVWRRQERSDMTEPMHTHSEGHGPATHSPAASLALNVHCWHLTIWQKGGGHFLFFWRSSYMICPDTPLCTLRHYNRPLACLIFHFTILILIYFTQVQAFSQLDIFPNICWPTLLAVWLHLTS